MMNVKGFGRKRPWPNFKLISQYSPGGTEENYKSLSQDIPVCGPRFEPGSFRIRSGSADHTTTTFGVCITVFTKTPTGLYLGSVEASS
jgi:hypothetical protein